MCDRENQLHAYYDDELNPSERAAFEAHLHDCADCRAQLAELRALSQFMQNAALPVMAATLSNEIFDAFRDAREARERGLRHLAGWMTAAAAAVLIFASTGWHGSTTTSRPAVE